MVSRPRFELGTLWLKVKCSTCWANGTNLAASGGFGPPKCQSQSLMPYRLATRQSKWWRDMDLNHGTRRNRFTVCRVWPLRYPSKKNGADRESRTPNLLITSQLRCQLRYVGKINGGRCRTRTYDPLLVRQVL